MSIRFDARTADMAAELKKWIDSHPDIISSGDLVKKHDTWAWVLRRGEIKNEDKGASVPLITADGGDGIVFRSNADYAGFNIEGNVGYGIDRKTGSQRFELRSVGSRVELLNGLYRFCVTKLDNFDDMVRRHGDLY